MADIHPMKTAAETALAEAFALAREELPGGHDIRELRDAAFESFRAAGLPHRRVEEWKYRDLRALMRRFPLGAPAFSSGIRRPSLSKRSSAL